MLVFRTGKETQCREHALAGRRPRDVAAFDPDRISSKPEAHCRYARARGCGIAIRYQAVLWVCRVPEETGTCAPPDLRGMGRAACHAPPRPLLQTPTGGSRGHPMPDRQQPAKRSTRSGTDAPNRRACGIASAVDKPVGANPGASFTDLSLKSTSEYHGAVACCGGLLAVSWPSVTWTAKSDLCHTRAPDTSANGGCFTVSWDERLWRNTPETGHVAAYPA